MSKSAYPQPRQDTDNAAFLAAWRSGRLVVQHCKSCGKSVFYPRPVCPHCWSESLESRDATGRGKVVSYSLVLRPNDPAFNDEVPIILVEIALEEGTLMLARLVDCTPEQVRSGLKVELPAPDVCARYPLPVFRPAGAS